MTLSARLGLDQGDACWKLEPVMPSRGPEELRRSGEARVSKAADRHTKSSQQALGAEQHSRPASRAEKAVDGASGIALLPVLPTLAGNAHSGLRKYGGVGERAAASALAVGATAQIDIDGLAACRDRQIAASATRDVLSAVSLIPHALPPSIKARLRRRGSARRRRDSPETRHKSVPHLLSVFHIPWKLFPKQPLLIQQPPYQHGHDEK
jgi:hypothetical protein